MVYKNCVFKKISNPSSHNFIIPFLLFILFTIVYCFHSLYRHFTFNSHAFDLGIYTQSIYLYSKGEFAFSTLKHMPIISDHFGVILLLLSPIYRIFPDATTLLIIQSVFVALSGFFIYLISKKALNDVILSLVLTLAFLTSPGLLSAITFDFHLATISVLPLSLILFAWYLKKNILYWGAFLFAILLKEDIPLLLFGLGIYQFLNNQKKLGFFTAIFSLISFYLIKFQIMPFFWKGSEEGYIVTSILPLFSPIDILYLFIIKPSLFVDIIFNSPIKLQTIDILYRSFSFIPVLSVLSWVTVLPYLFLRFSSNYQALWSNSFHHNANLIPFLAVSTILALTNFKFPKKALLILLIFSLSLGGLSPNSLIWSPLKANFNNLSQRGYIYRSLKKIPPNGRVSAQSPLVPHLANREKIYLYPDIFDAEYIILDLSLSSYPITSQELSENIKEIKKSPNWKIRNEDKSLIIFQKVI